MTAKTKTDKVRLRLTIVVEYDANPDDYRGDDPTDTLCETPEEMAALDLEALNRGEMWLADFLDGLPSYTVEVVR